jgi:hypothetical protein
MAVVVLVVTCLIVALLVWMLRILWVGMMTNKRTYKS